MAYIATYEVHPYEGSMWLEHYESDTLESLIEACATVQANARWREEYYLLMLIQHDQIKFHGEATSIDTDERFLSRFNAKLRQVLQKKREEKIKEDEKKAAARERAAKSKKTKDEKTQLKELMKKYPEIAKNA